MSAPSPLLGAAMACPSGEGEGPSSSCSWVGAVEWVDAGACAWRLVVTVGGDRVEGAARVASALTSSSAWDGSENGL